MQHCDETPLASRGQQTLSQTFKSTDDLKLLVGRQHRTGLGQEMAHCLILSTKRASTDMKLWDEYGVDAQGGALGLREGGSGHAGLDPQAAARRADHAAIHSCPCNFWIWVDSW